MMIHLSHRICEIGVKEFDFDEEIRNLKELKKQYAASVYSVVTRTNLPLESQSDILEATLHAELAAKQARLWPLEAQESQRARLAELQAEQKHRNLELERAVVEQRRILELLQVRQEVEEVDARYRAINFSSIDGASVRSGVESGVWESTLNPSSVSFTSNHASRQQSEKSSQLIGIISQSAG